jgi:hypothetical protein
VFVTAHRDNFPVYDAVFDHSLLIPTLMPGIIRLIPL